MCVYVLAAAGHCWLLAVKKAVLFAIRISTEATLKPLKPLKAATQVSGLPLNPKQAKRCISKAIAAASSKEVRSKKN
jgi:hypothetical protein